jgi:hypothetical protein
VNLIVLGIWIVLWAIGGVWLTRMAFHLEERALLPVGLLSGLLLQTVLANLLAQLVPLNLASWLAAVGVFVAGLMLMVRYGMKKWDWLPPILPGQWLLLMGLFLFSFAMQRGLALFDDFAHLPTVSLLATGAVPPHFPLDGAVRYAYHHFLLLVAAQMTRLSGQMVWVTLDAARALGLTLFVALAVIWTHRLTHSRLAAWLGGVAALFASGTRWLLLLLPGAWMDALSRQIVLIGSGLASGANLEDALSGVWGIEGVGPQPYWFAVGNGFFHPGVLAQFGPVSVLDLAVLLWLLLTGTRWRNNWAAMLSVFAMAALSFITEAEVVYLYAAFGLLSVWIVVRQRSLRLPRRLMDWLGVLVMGAFLGVFQGGALYDILYRLLRNETVGSYHVVEFVFHWYPILVSRHLGALNLLRPLTLLVALLEAGPLLLILPGVVYWGGRALRAGRWFEAAFGLATLLSIGSLFVQYGGSEGIANTERLYFFFSSCLLWAVPLGWRWAQRSANRAVWAGSLLALACVSGVVLTLTNLFAISRPQAAVFLNHLDAQMTKRYWGHLPQDANIFDFSPSRAVTVFGRATNSHFSWYVPKPGWKDLTENPQPRLLAQAGFTHAYFDYSDWRKLSVQQQAAWQDACVVLVEELNDVDTEQFRRLYDLRNCVR